MRRLFFLLAAHALCDFPLQGDFLARGKDHTNPLYGVPWYQCLAAHSLIHAGAVAAITGSVGLGAAELVIHAATDYAKCQGLLTFNQDQAIHYGAKLLWAALGREQ
jgi:Protein of unknown function (DUF3307)